MQEEPRNNNFLTAVRRDASMIFAAIMTLSYKNSPGRVSLARMPPTVAAATNTTSGALARARSRVSSLTAEIYVTVIHGEDVTVLRAPTAAPMHCPPCRDGRRQIPAFQRAKTAWSWP